MVPLREDQGVPGENGEFTVPLPVPLAFEVMVIHEALLTAVQEQRVRGQSTICLNGFKNGGFFIPH